MAKLNEQLRLGKGKFGETRKVPGEQHRLPGQSPSLGILSISTIRRRESLTVHDSKLFEKQLPIFDGRDEAYRSDSRPQSVYVLGTGI